MLAGHLLVLLAALTCLRLGWWQWNVAHATRGTAQNLGYALLWPVFAGAFIYMWLRFLHLESVRDAELTDDRVADEPSFGDGGGGGDGSGGGSRDGAGRSEGPRPGGGDGAAEVRADDARAQHPLGMTGTPARGKFTDGSFTDGPVTDGFVTDSPVTDRPFTDSSVTDGSDGESLGAPGDLDRTAPADDRPAGDEAAADPADLRRPRKARRPGRPAADMYTIAVATVGGEDDEDDSELAAYNRALAALAEQDRRRAR